MVSTYVWYSGVPRIEHRSRDWLHGMMFAIGDLVSPSGKFGRLPEFRGARGGVVVKALRYKQAGRGFDSRWCHWNFSVT